jgi:fumarylacetoacetate (FAA) hydrolase
MKLASLKGGRDGRLVVVSDDLAYFAYAGHIATTLQDALDNWEMLAPKLELLATDLAHAAIPRERFHERETASPLPRAYGWIVEGKAKASGSFGGARDPLSESSEHTDVESGVVVVTADVPKGAKVEDACALIRLVGLSLGCGAATCFSPVFVTPDSLGSGWNGGKLHGVLCVDRDGKSISRADTGGAMQRDFGTLISEAAQARPLGAGTIIGSGPISESAAAQTSNLAPSASVRIWMDDDKHHPIFGVIEQKVG